MQMATTKEVRKIVKDAFGYKALFTDRTTNPGERIVGYNMPENLDVAHIRIETMFRAMGYNNKVYKTGGQYVRIRAAMP